MISSLGLWGHLALGTLLETCLKDAVFEINVFSKKIPKIAKIKNVNFDTKIKKRIIFRYYFDSISTFRYTSNRMFSKTKTKTHENCQVTRLPGQLTSA